MYKASVTDELSTRIADRRVIAGVFTTFNFEPDFFELDVIPELLSKGIPYSTDDRVKIFQVREALRESGVLLSVFYDLQILRESATRSPEMEYLCHGVNSGNNAFHAKNIYLLVEGEDQKQALLVAAGSNNITRAGWWKNIEVQHWEEVVSGEVQRAFVNRLKEDIDGLEHYRSSTKNRDASLDKIKTFLEKCRGANNAKVVHYYSLRTNNLLKFLKNTGGKPLSEYANWKLEIISPYFAEDPHKDLHIELKKNVGIEQITLLLPLDDAGAALCQKEYYEHINDSEGIEWGQWRQSIAEGLGLSSVLFRRLHAKIYHFYNGKQAWVFVGSVNFSYKAIYENTESGFLVKLPSKEPMLKSLAEDTTVVTFKPPQDEESDINITPDRASLPELHLTYDWKTQKLFGRTAEEKQYKIQLLNPENKPVIEPWTVEDQDKIYNQQTKDLEKTLRQGSLIRVTGKNKKTGEKFSEHKIMLQQIGWTHKPIDLPQLTPAQIIAIYAGMTPEQRQMTVMTALLRKLLEGNVGGEITGIDGEENDQQFFCEYAEIFHAFRIFRKRLYIAIEKKDFAKVDYYLTGTGMDSLPTLIEQVSDEKSPEFDGVTAYLLLLSTIEIFSVPEFTERPNVEKHLKNVHNILSDLKRGTAIELENKPKERRTDFFKWFEEQFSREYVEVEVLQDSSEVVDK